ncbi:glycosyltransferase family 4 protein [Candidatus Curtissbacteria bacterium]|nr:glycosyltransferase family 4 protein [Candidatus Curtissbacteria bacterium]
MKKLKIAILTEIIDYHSGSRAPLQIAKYLAKLQKITVYAYDHQKDPKVIADLKKNGVTTILITTPKIPPVSRYLAAFNLTQKLRSHSPNVILFAGTLTSFLAAKLTTIPIIRIYMGTQLDAYLEKVFPQKITFLDKLLNFLANCYIFATNLITYRLSDKIVAISHYAASEGKKLYGRAVDKVIYLASDLAPTTGHKLPATNYRQEIAILAVSRITPYKGFHLIIDALKKIGTTPKITLTIIGSQPRKNYLDYLQKEGQSLAKIIVNASDQTLAQNYQSCDFYVTCDQNLYFGLPICEAATFAKPTIALDYGAANELIIHGKTGYIAKNQRALIYYLGKLTNNPQLVQKLGKEAKKYTFAKFNWQKIVKDYQEVIDK